MMQTSPVRRVQVRYLSRTPVGAIQRASGLSDVEVDGPTLRCLVCGNFQPFLEALHGHEVVTLTSIPAEAMEP